MTNLTILFKLKLPLTLSLVLSLASLCHPVKASEKDYVYRNDGTEYAYQIKETGVNYHFQFTNPISDPEQRKQAGLHVLNSVYQDTSIETNFSKAYTKERADCFALDSRFYTYTLCFLPNDFAKEHKQRFWGFVTRVPNWTWQFTYVLLPVALAALLGFYCLGSKKRAVNRLP